MWWRSRRSSRRSGNRFRILSSVRRVTRGENSMQRKGLLYVISAPSGAGKTSICRELVKLFPNLLSSISYTTRPMRAGEQDGVDYHFVSHETFGQMVSNGEFAEWAEVQACVQAGIDFPAAEPAHLDDLLPKVEARLQERLRGGSRHDVVIALERRDDECPVGQRIPLRLHEVDAIDACGAEAEEGTPAPKPSSPPTLLSLPAGEAFRRSALAAAASRLPL